MKPDHQVKSEDSPVLCRLADVAEQLDHAKTLLVSDARVFSLYGKHFSNLPHVLIPEGEAAKSLDALPALFDSFVQHRVDRSWSVLALGGGSVSDTAGFAAHVWMRGLGFYATPTTLLALCDAALGGKNGLDYGGYKNVIGSFHFPLRLFCDVETLRSLEPEQFASGMAEAVKHGILEGGEHFAYLEDCAQRYEGEKGLDYRSCPPEVLERIVYLSQQFKLGIVAQDPKESGKRRLLNLGHSFGHALESASGMPHGFAVSLGIGLAASYACARGRMEETELHRILSLLSACGLPVSLGAYDLDGSLKKKAAELLFMDKKRVGRQMHFILPEGIGAVKIEKIPVDELLSFLLKDSA
ncbi:MAG: 3-dehydroquinate synthase family protein [Spirochaetia bacterium]|jgi:3-dehydroquinate synthase|nr:3-dehydroquinate synthase family protein [Spirochaetia bacterium]